jgi:hypothetical protein
MKFTLEHSEVTKAVSNYLDNLGMKVTNPETVFDVDEDGNVSAEVKVGGDSLSEILGKATVTAEETPKKTRRRRSKAESQDSTAATAKEAEAQTSTTSEAPVQTATDAVTSGTSTEPTEKAAEVTPEPPFTPDPVVAASTSGAASVSGTSLFG